MKLVAFAIDIPEYLLVNASCDNRNYILYNTDFFSFDKDMEFDIISEVE